VNKLFDVSELQLDGSFDIVVPNYGGMIADDFQAAIQFPQMVVRQL
jgi:hypothetical protein